jgi:hypothetical protein
MSFVADHADADSGIDTEYTISVKPRRIDGYVRWLVTVAALRGSSRREEILSKHEVPFLYPNAVDVIRKAIDSEGRARFA